MKNLSKSLISGTAGFTLLAFFVTQSAGSLPFSTQDILRGEAITQSAGLEELKAKLGDGQGGVQLRPVNHAQLGTRPDRSTGLEEKDFSEFMGKKLYAVHATDYLPNGGIVETYLHSTKGRIPRNTVHWALNHAVEPVEFSSWEEKKYFIVVPLKDLVEANPGQVLGGTTVDFYFYENLKLPPSTRIVSSKAQVDQLLQQHATLESGGKWGWNMDIEPAWKTWMTERGILDTPHAFHWTHEWEEVFRQAPEYYYGAFMDSAQRAEVLGKSPEEIRQAVLRRFQLRSQPSKAFNVPGQIPFLDLFLEPTAVPDFKEFIRRIAADFQGSRLTASWITAQDKKHFQSLVEKQLEYADGLSAEAVLQCLPRSVRQEDIVKFHELLEAGASIPPEGPEAEIQTTMVRRGVTDRKNASAITVLMLERFELIQKEVTERARSIVRELPIQVTQEMLETIRSQFVEIDQPVLYGEETLESRVLALISSSLYSYPIFLQDRSHLEAIFEEIQKQLEPVRTEMTRQAEAIARVMKANRITLWHLNSFQDVELSWNNKWSFAPDSPEATLRLLKDQVTVDDLAQLEQAIPTIEGNLYYQIEGSPNERFRIIYKNLPTKIHISPDERKEILSYLSAMRSEWDRVHDSVRAEAWLKDQFKVQGLLDNWTVTNNIIELIRNVFSSGLEERWAQVAAAKSVAILIAVAEAAVRGEGRAVVVDAVGLEEFPGLVPILQHLGPRFARGVILFGRSDTAKEVARQTGIPYVPERSSDAVAAVLGGMVGLEEVTSLVPENLADPIKIAAGARGLRFVQQQLSVKSFLMGLSTPEKLASDLAAGLEQAVGLGREA